MTPALPDQRLAQLRESVKGYADLEKVAAEFRGWAAMVETARKPEEKQ